MFWMNESIDHYIRIYKSFCLSESSFFFQHKTLCIFYKQFVCMVYCCSSVVCTYVVLYCCTAFHSIRLLPRQVGVPIFLVHKGSLAELSRYWVQLVYALPIHIQHVRHIIPTTNSETTNLNLHQSLNIFLKPSKKFSAFPIS